MSHQIAYTVTDRIPAEILDGEILHAPAPGPAQHEPARIVLALGDLRVVIPNGLALAALAELGGDLIRLADAALGMVEPAAEPAADEAQPAKKRGRSK